MTEIKYEIEEQIAVLSDRGNGWRKELNRISWNGKEAKLDIREWNEDHTKMRKGVTLTDAEARRLKRALEVCSEV